MKNSKKIFMINKKYMISCIAKVHLPTQFGMFELLLYHDHQEKTRKDHIVLIKGNIKNKTRVLTRIHSECLTGDVFGSLRCDCAEQLHSAIESISRENEGILMYLRQEGRGIGLINKILAYELQDRGLNTISANKALGLPVDSRDYSLAVAILEDLKVKSIRLLTNNPQKLEVFSRAHIPCVERVPIEIHPNPYNNNYLKIKRDEMGHYLSPDKMISNEPDNKLTLLKFVYFFDENRPHFQLSNFGGKGIYHNRYGDQGEYSEITYQACKFAYLPEKKISASLRKKYFAEVKLPIEAYLFMKEKRPELGNRSINDVIEHGKWLKYNEYKITNKELEMLLCLLDKFNPAKHLELFKSLISVVNNNKIILVEANPDDSFWGYRNENSTEFGSNKFGLMLTAIAHTIKNQRLIEKDMTSKNNLQHISHYYKALNKMFDGFNFHISLAS